MTEYKKLTDEELIRRLRMGETGIIDYLMEKYKNLVRKEANAMYLLGGETDDLIQEGMIGLFKAVQDYDVDQEELLVSQEHAKSLEERLEKDLSELERRVLYLHLMGTDYKTIAKLLDRSPKTIDNALQRIKGKMQRILEKEK